MQSFAQICEILMILLFGLSWPISIRKSYTARTAKGKSLFFEVFIAIGYVFGIIMKVTQLQFVEPSFLFWLSWVFYILNIIEICIDMALYFRNRKLDKLADAAAEEAKLKEEVNVLDKEVEELKEEIKGKKD